MRRLAREDDWTPAIEALIGELEGLNRSTERDFLAVGEKLMEFRTAARRISKEMTVLTEVISGEQSRHAKATLDRTLEHSRGMTARIESGGAALGAVREQTVRLRHTFSDLPTTVATLRTLCTLTRIETSRLGNTTTGFGDLAEEVRPLSESIQASGESVLNAAARLDQGVQAALKSASELRARQLHELPALIATVVESMQAFAERQQRAREASVRHAAEYEALREAIEGLVHSVQFHDITRQQVEHVTEALEPLLEPGARHARTLLTLQSSQLRAAGRVFAKAMLGIERDLDSIASRLQGMAGTSRTLLGVSEGEHTSFFRKMEECFATIRQAVGACTQAEAAIGSTAAEVASMAEDMRKSVEEIGGTAIRIQRIAINATIQAAHIGDRGDPLSVIADGMQQMAAASNNTTETANTALDAVRDAARRLAESAHSTPPEDAGGTISDLHAAGELSFSSANQIADLAASLSAEIAALRGGISAGKLFAEVVERGCEELDRMAAEAPADHPDAAGELEELAASYTMQMERDVHQQVTTGELVTVEATDTLGDNVELF